MSDPLLAFIDFDETTGPVVVDRSTLERYATCPAQAHAVETGRVLDRSAAMESGIAVHEALSAGVTAYVRSRASLNPQELRQEVEAHVLGSRPDIQPDAVRGIRASLWAWSKWLHSLNPDNILRWDGGEGERSGQLGVDLPGLNVRITAELDFLHAGPSPLLLHSLDWKTGWKHHGVQAIRDAFQFQLHWLLVAETYPAIQALQVTVWDTRTNRRSWPVEFTRGDLPAIAARVRSAAGEWWKARSGFEPETWPTVEKCPKCPAAAICPASGIEPDSAEAMIDALVALEAKGDAWRKRLVEIVKHAGVDIRTAAGNVFGFDKPKRSRKVAETYQAEAPEQEQNGDASD